MKTWSQNHAVDMIPMPGDFRFHLIDSVYDAKCIDTSLSIQETSRAERRGAMHCFYPFILLVSRFYIFAKNCKMAALHLFRSMWCLNKLRRLPVLLQRKALLRRIFLDAERIELAIVKVQVGTYLINSAPYLKIWLNCAKLNTPD